MTLSRLDSFDYVFGIGVKCNTAAVRKRLGIQQYSSPFDNMDSVHGLRDMARVLRLGTNEYFGSKDDWILRNDYAPRDMTLRAKVLYHADYPGLLYPHFYSGWFESSVRDNLEKWIKDPDANKDFIWSGFSQTFSRRLDRLIGLLKTGARVLLLRIDAPSSLNRIYSSGNTLHDIQYFVDVLTTAGFAGFQLLYIYAHNCHYKRAISNADGPQLDSPSWRSIGLAADAEFDNQVEATLSRLFK